jgi:hypothetical protein
MAGLLRAEQRLRFAREPGKPVGVVGERVRQHLDGDATLQLRVGRAVHLPHSAHAYLGGDFIRTEAHSEGEGQPFGLYGPDGGADGITPACRPLFGDDYGADELAQRQARQSEALREVASLSETTTPGAVIVTRRAFRFSV